MNPEMPQARASPRRSTGFTLLEVLIAFAIAAPALALLFQGGLTAVAASDAASRYREALERARSHLSMLSDTDLVPGERSGDEGRGFHCQTRIAPVATATPAPAPGGRYANGTTLYAITVQVSWHGPARSRALSLTTRRIGPASAATP